MPQLEKSFETYERPGVVIAYRMAKVKIWKGALVGIDATGYLRPLDPSVAGMRFMGVANETVDNVPDGEKAKSVNVTKTGSFVMKAARGYVPTLADLGTEAFAASDWEVRPSETRLPNAYRVGTIVAVESDATGVNGVRIRIDNHSV